MDPDPEGPKTYGSGSTTLHKEKPQCVKQTQINWGNRVRIGNPFLVSVLDPDSSIPDPDPAFQAKCQSESRSSVLITNNFKKITAGKHLSFLDHQLLLAYPQVSIKDNPATGEAFRPLFLWIIFAFLDPDLDSKSGSRSTDLIEFGSNPDPVPKHCCLRVEYLFQHKKLSTMPLKNPKILFKKIQIGFNFVTLLFLPLYFHCKWGV